MQLKILRTEKSTDDSISIYFERTQLLENYKAGQHGNFSFLIDGAIHSRTYSFHTSPNDREVGITVRAITDGVVSNYLQSSNGNTNVMLDSIAGDFTLEPSKDIKRHLIMFAAGSGITPIFSMIQTLMQEEPRSTVSLIYSNKSYSRIIFKNGLHSIEQKYFDRLKVHHVITQDDHSPADFPVFYKGRLSPLIIKKTIKAILSEVDCSIEYYMCGPNTFMEIIASTIRAIDPDRPRVKREHFFIPSNKNELDISALQDREIALQIQGENKMIIVKGGQSILQASLEQGVKLPFSCTEGQCGTCRAKVISGEVKLRKNFILSEEELKEGQILLCQGFPVSDGVTIGTSL